MRAQDLEPETEKLLLRVVPDLADRWRGVTDAEIQEIETLAGRPLPRFYRWFLGRMGGDMGPLAFSTMDFTAAKLRASYAEGAVTPDPRCLLIGWQSDEGMPLHMFYDFAHPARDDARVVKRHLMGGPFHNQFETFREMLAWGALARFQVETAAQRCVGLIGDTNDNDVLAHLAPVMKRLGFASPVRTGPCCGLYEGPDACLITSAVPGDPPRFHVFRIGGVDAARIRRVLGEITNSTSLEVEVKSWSPSL